jgi:hypothetical protein
VNNEIAIGFCVSRLCETNPELSCQFRSAGVDVDERDVRTGDPPAQIGDKGTDHAGPDNGDAVGWSWCRVPHAVKRGFHVGRQHRAEWRHILRKRHRRACRDVECGLVGVERKDGLALRGIAAVLDLSYSGVAVFDGKWKIACHERRAHPLEFAHRYPPAKNERFSAAADCAVEGLHAYFAGAGRCYGFLAELDLFGSAIPKSQSIFGARADSHFLRSRTGIPDGLPCYKW